MTTPRTAILYVRVSDQKQAEADVSIPAQIEAGTRKAEALGARLLRTFTDSARSAYVEGNRPEFQAAIDYAIAMEAGYFITWSSSRFARNKIEAGLYKRELDRAGVRLVYIANEIDRGTDEGWLLDSVLEIVDELHSRQIGKDTKRSMIRNAQQGYFTGARPPFGFTVIPAPDNPKRRKLVADPAETATVREIFALRLRGLGGTQIARQLNERGLLHRGGRWSKNMILHTLRNEAHIGQRIFNRRDRKTGRERPREAWIIVQSHDPTIDAEDWAAVQDQMNDAADAATGSPLSTHPFTGILRCAHCGGAMQIETAKGNGGRYAYYVCRRAKRDGECTLQRYRAAELDDYLSDVLLDRVLSPQNLRELAVELESECGQWAQQQRQRRTAVAKRLADIEQRQRRLYETLELHGKDAPNLGDLTRRLRENNGEIKQLEAELTAIEAEQRPEFEADQVELQLLADTLRSLLKETASAPRARAFYAGFVQQIRISPESIEVQYDPARLVSQAGPVHSIRNWRPVFGALRTVRVVVPVVGLCGRGVVAGAGSRFP